MNRTSQACPPRKTLQLKDHGAASRISAMGRLAAPDGHPVQLLWGFPFQGNLYMCSEVKARPVGKRGYTFVLAGRYLLTSCHSLVSASAFHTSHTGPGLQHP